MSEQLPVPPMWILDTLPKQARDDVLTLIMWCEYYGGKEEQEAAARLIDYLMPVPKKQEPT
jgi:hypothetical protein